MRGLIDGLVVLTEAGRVPALFNLRVHVSRAIEVSIDLLEDGNGDLVVVSLESVVEDNLQVGVETVVIRVVSGRSFTCTGNISKSKCG